MNNSGDLEFHEKCAKLEGRIETLRTVRQKSCYIRTGNETNSMDMFV